MATLKENITQTIRDLDNIREAIKAQGIEIPAGTVTARYADLIAQIDTGDNLRPILDFINNRWTTTQYGPEYDEITSRIIDATTLFITAPVSSFGSDLSNLANGMGMFANCNDLISFSAPLPVLTNGNSMFGNCYNLKTLDTRLPALTHGDEMFVRCTALTTFSPSLSALESGENMFLDCNSLTEESLVHILTTLPDRSGATTATITIGPTNRNKLSAGQLAVATDKNWTVN